MVKRGSLESTAWPRKTSKSSDAMANHDLEPFNSMAVRASKTHFMLKGIFAQVQLQGACIDRKSNRLAILHQPELTCAGEVTGRKPLTMYNRYLISAVRWPAFPQLLMRLRQLLGHDCAVAGYSGPVTLNETLDCSEQSTATKPSTMSRPVQSIRHLN